MLKRKIQENLLKWRNSPDRKPLMIIGARQVGKTFIIRNILFPLYENSVEINLVNDEKGPKLFAKIQNLEDFFLKVNLYAKKPIKEKKTIIFIDEIQHYQNLDVITLCKFLYEDGRYDYVFSGSLLGNYLYQTTSVPVGFLNILTMYPLDFEEYLWANGVDDNVLKQIHNNNFRPLIPLDDQVHEYFMSLFRKYLIIGGLPEAVSIFLKSQNIFDVQSIHTNIHRLYLIDASQYARNRTPFINHIYSLIPAQLGSKTKRFMINKTNKRINYSEASEDYLWLTNAGIVTSLYQVSIPSKPLLYSKIGSFVKLYLNDCGILTTILFDQNAGDILNDLSSINIGSIYECAIANQLYPYVKNLTYYDSKKHGEVEFLFEHNNQLTILEIKSGKNYMIHSAFNYVMENKEYKIDQGYILCNKNIHQRNGRIYLPIYMIIFLLNNNKNQP